MSLTSQIFALEPFQASYQVSFNDKAIGSAMSSLEESNGGWTYKFDASAGELIKSTATSIFSINNGVIQPTTFNRTTKLFLSQDTKEIQFDIPNQQILAKDKKNSNSYALEPNLFDELSAELQIREDLQNGELKEEYLIADVKGIKSLQLTQDGAEEIQTNIGMYETIKVNMKHDDADKQTIFWLSPFLNYLPIKILHIDKNMSYSILLNDYKNLKN